MPQSEQSLPGVQYTGLSPGLLNPPLLEHSVVMQEIVFEKSQLSFCPGSLHRLIESGKLLHGFENLHSLLHTHMGWS
jgi:hypothetical protein